MRRGERGRGQDVTGGGWGGSVRRRLDCLVGSVQLAPTQPDTPHHTTPRHATPRLAQRTLPSPPWAPFYHVSAIISPPPPNGPRPLPCAAQTKHRHGLHPPPPTPPRSSLCEHLPQPSCLTRALLYPGPIWARTAASRHTERQYVILHVGACYVGRRRGHSLGSSVEMAPVGLTPARGCWYCCCCTGMP